MAFCFGWDAIRSIGAMLEEIVGFSAGMFCSLQEGVFSCFVFALCSNRDRSIRSFHYNRIDILLLLIIIVKFTILILVGTL